MKPETQIRLWSAVVLIICLLYAWFQPVFAAANIPVTVEIPVRYEAAAGQSETFLLQAKDKNTPMPEGSVSGEKELTLTKAGRAGFGEITYTGPGVYEYEVRRASSSGSEDKTVYCVQVIAQNDGEGSVIVRKQGEMKKSELIFTDRAIPGRTPKTGDRMPLIPAGMIAIGSLAVLLYAAEKERRRRYD